ncbi:MAG: hypothetical protein EAZ27_04100 [Cytophagales bacterium]|nr:MAG: hypothetical protein EAZ27_04100 [Cytophagales bacterium]
MIFIEIIMKYLFLFLSFIMCSFMVVQYNDPDPLMWMTIYGTVSVFLALAAFNIYFPILLYIQMAMMLIGIIYLFPSVIDWIKLENGNNLMQQMNNSKLYIEETRECGGLIVAFIFVSLIVIKSRK